MCVCLYVCLQVRLFEIYVYFLHHLPDWLGFPQRPPSLLVALPLSPELLPPLLDQFLLPQRPPSMFVALPLGLQALPPHLCLVQPRFSVSKSMHVCRVNVAVRYDVYIYIYFFLTSFKSDFVASEAAIAVGCATSGSSATTPAS